MSIYDQYDKDFAQVTAWAIVTEQGEKTGTATLKHPQRGDGKLKLYLHLHGSQMICATISGCGYDKLSTVLKNAAMDYPKEALTEYDKLFIEALKQLNYDFSDHNKYGKYCFIKAV